MTDTEIVEEVPAEPVEDERMRFIRINQEVLEWSPPENEYEIRENSFDTALAWEALLTLPSCQEMMLKEPVQKILNLKVGLNVTEEFPWKQITFRKLRDVFDEIPNGQVLHNTFQSYQLDDHVLVGYAPLITQSMDDAPAGDPFVLYVDPADAKLALTIIRNIETFERLLMNKRLFKQPRKWVSLGSEDEVNLTLTHRHYEAVEVEIQSVYPLTIPANKEFSPRLSGDARDGYVELLPPEGANFENVFRRRITVGIQSSFPRVDVEQQTDPTFPTNAWAQYLYEVEENDDGLDEESEEERPKDKPVSKPPTPELSSHPKPAPQVSENIKLLLRTLEFNQIDMYRDDYPLISDKCVVHYTSPYLEETLCFVNIAKSQNRFMCGYDWYPALAGLLVTSYTYSTAGTIETGKTKYDAIQRDVLENKPVLMWSFNDNLNYKLEFESTLEVVSLSFCPYDPNVLVGGATNGQIILWDLQNRADNLDIEEMLSSAQITYRVLMNEFLKWTIEINEEILVPPATVSGLEYSQRATITSIQWLASNTFVNTFGKVSTVPLGSARCRFFMTTSLDGTIAFWNLDAQTGRKVASTVRRDLPAILTQSESAYKGKILIPIFSVAFNEPITSIVADTPVFKFKIKDKFIKNEKNRYNYAIRLEENNLPEVRQSCVISSLYGRIERLLWLGLYADADGREIINTSVNFARVHDGPVISMKKNPFYPWLFVSIGRTIFAVWKEDYNYSPIFWRKRKCDLTAVAWSESRPSVLFLTRIDGTIEAWDILSRDDDAILIETLGGGIITNICEHKTSEPEKLLGFGDYNSSLRMVKLPRSLYVVQDQEVEDMQKYILKEEGRKKAIQAWEQNYNEQNKEFIEAKQQAELEAHKEMERIEKETLLKATKKANEEEEKRAAQPIVHLSYTERMKKQWYELNLKRLLDILMSRKRVNEKQLNEQTILEKERLAYEAAKKESLAQVLKRINSEVAAIRLAILPPEEPDLQRNDTIQASVDHIMQTIESYQSVADEAHEELTQSQSFGSIDYAEFLNRGQHRRKLLNKSLGGNTERCHWYDTMLEENLIGDCDWGLETYAELLQTVDGPTLAPPSSERNLLTTEENQTLDGQILAPPSSQINLLTTEKNQEGDKDEIADVEAGKYP